MQFQMAELSPRQRYKILVSTVTPRPIAWVTTIGPDGVVNAAPYSFFNAVGDEPPLVVLGLLKAAGTGEDKDTAANVRATGEFVINLVREDDAERMNLSCVDAPRNVSEIDYAQIATTEAIEVAPPLIATAPVSFECRLVQALDIGPRQTVVIGEVLVTHVGDEFISDPEQLHFDTPSMSLIGRIHGPGNYVRLTDTFTMDRGAFDPDRLAALRQADDAESGQPAAISDQDGGLAPTAGIVGDGEPASQPGQAGGR
ncbi:flavin reductase family protein [Cumulibacter manganitolerans]|uniref:flavin reductase family protein n=1 Tax=Cumulibacter manganitolerans TaxID=1884992 RepID=UPI001294F42B|nr:flavin reductase family protein [Cumulibacter manganitolerans]